MSSKMAVLEMFKAREIKGMPPATSLSIGTPVGMLTFRVGGPAIAVPSEIVPRLERDYKDCLRRAKGDEADEVIKSAQAIYRAQFVARNGGTAEVALTKAAAELEAAQRKYDEAAAIASDVKDYRANGPINRSVSQPRGNKG